MEGNQDMNKLYRSPEVRIAEARQRIADEEAKVRALRKQKKIDAKANPVPRARISYKANP
jgi:hypothetical protein